MSSRSSCSDTVDVPSHDGRDCLAQFVLLPCSSHWGKIPARHPSVLCWFLSYTQLTDGCLVFPLPLTSLHQLVESYRDARSFIDFASSFSGSVKSKMTNIKNIGMN